MCEVSGECQNFLIGCESVWVLLRIIGGGFCICVCVFVCVCACAFFVERGS